jgi:Uma2 family endonuclease
MATQVRQKTPPKTVNGRTWAQPSNVQVAATEEFIDGLISEDGLHVSEAEYWEKYYEHPDFSYEWNNGVLEVKPMAEVIDALLYRWFYLLLSTYLTARPLATMLNLEIGFRLALPEKATIRKPDLFIVRHDNPAPLGLHDRTFKGICDLCIESLSDSTRKERERDTKVKKLEYALVDVPECYILDAGRTHTAFYRLSTRGVYQEIAPGPEGVIRSEVLPGFQFRIADLYRQPPLIELIEDEVYRSYVLLDYQAERARAEQEHARAEQERIRAEQERTRAEQERIRAEQEHTRAERLVAKLRELGIDTENL